MTRILTNNAASIKARLRNRHRETGGNFEFLLQRYAGERFLYRLGESPHRNLFVLKGAALFALWGGPLYRPTQDLDFTGYGESSPATVEERMRDICRVSEPTDGLEFDPQSLSSEPIRNAEVYGGINFRFKARLGQALITMRIDVGFGDRIEPPPRDVEYPTLLPPLPAAQIRAYPREAMIAEKAHAMAEFGELNTRIKDFYDLYTLARHFSFEAESLSRGIAATFEQRQTRIEALPATLTPRFFADARRSDEWRRYLSRNALVTAPTDFTTVGELLLNFLAPIWTALATNQPLRAIWPPGGPWQDPATAPEAST